MTSPATELLNQIRQQFDSAPYPRIPLESSPKHNYTELYKHNLMTPYYLRDQQIVSSKNKLILDVGCGSGYTSLLLAEANPGAKIVGIDISEQSINLARKRLDFYGFTSAEFHVMAVEQLVTLDTQFDYINCDEVLYLLVDPIAGLNAMKAVLAPEGILRANFHSALQRKLYRQVQKFSRMIGLMESDDQEAEINILREIMRNLRSDVYVKQMGWSQRFEENDQAVLANHLLRGDKGWTIPEFFQAIKQCALEFISMVDWQSWDLTNLFTDISELPIEIALLLADSSEEEQLHMYELLHANSHRLLDLWCGHPQQTIASDSPETWSTSDWERKVIHLHPQLLNEPFRQGLLQCASDGLSFDFHHHLAHQPEAAAIDSKTAACLLPLLDMPKSFTHLVQRHLKLWPLDPVSLSSNTVASAQTTLQGQLQRLESLGYVMFEAMEG